MIWQKNKRESKIKTFPLMLEPFTKSCCNIRHFRPQKSQNNAAKVLAGLNDPNTETNLQQNA